MKAIASVAIAAIIAATSLTTTTNAAYAGGNNWNKYQQQPYKHHGKPYKGKNYYKGNNHSNGWNPGAALATGAILGLAFGALAAPTYYYPPPVYAYPPPPPPPPPVYPTYYSGYQGPANPQHVSWCYSKYRSYNARYNTWIGYDGLAHQCVSPF